MDRQRKQAVAALFAAGSVLAAGAFCPAPPRAAWWCTAFTVVPAEAASPAPDGAEQAQFRFWLADWLRSFAQ